MREECPTPSDACPYADRPGGCFSDVDHAYYPAIDYSGIMGTEFRELPENKEQRCRWEHEQRHFDELPPDKPTREHMLGRIATAYYAGEITLSKRKLKRLGIQPRK
jgi:hypothetical protein